MKARKVLQEASYDPQTLKAICQAFDEAWAGIADMYDPSEVEDARLELANSVLAVAGLHGTDVQALSEEALVRFAQDKRTRRSGQVSPTSN